MKPRAGELKSHVEHIVYIFEGFRLDAGRRQLSTSGGVVLPLNSRAMEALVMLVSRAGNLVTKRELLEGVWPSAVVEDNNINQCVLAIRKALGESAGSNRFIMTVPGRGYRFVAPVTPHTREVPDEAPPITAPRSVADWKSLAIGAAAVMLLAGLAIVRMSGGHGGGSELIAKPVLVVQLRHDDELGVAPAAALLAECLRQRPDLHLQVEVRVMGAQSGPPVWTGEYIAGANDVIQQGPPREADPNACHSLLAAP